MGQRKLFSKLDWFSGAFAGVTLEELLNHFAKYIELDVEHMKSHRYISASQGGYSRDYVFELFPGVNFRIYFDYFKVFPELEDVNIYLYPEAVHELSFERIFTKRFDKIMFNCSGMGLDKLRELGYNVDEQLRLMFPDIVNPEEGKTFHMTRADFAFDFINWGSDLPYLFNDLMSDKDVRQRGLFYGDLGQPLTTECRLSSTQSTVYIGKGSNEKVLRIYDKLLQYRGSEFENTPIEYCEGSGDDRQLPESWMRIELQTRRGSAQKLITGHDPNSLTSIDMDYWDKRYWCGVLRWIYEYYGPKVHYGDPVADFWEELFDWEHIEAVIQNAKYVSPKSTRERALLSSVRGYSSNIKTIAFEGMHRFTRRMNTSFYNRQRNDISFPRFFRELCDPDCVGSASPPDSLEYGSSGYTFPELDHVCLTTFIYENLPEEQRLDFNAYIASYSPDIMEKYKGPYDFCYEDYL